MSKNERAPIPHICTDDAYSESLSFRGQYCITCRWYYTRVNVFICHGRDPQWTRLRDHLRDRQQYSVTYYESSATVGYCVDVILEKKAKMSNFAVLILTGEDVQKDGTLHPRLNVIQELGYFQASLGLKKVIILLERGVKKWSNISGIQYLSFEKGNIDAVFGDVVATIRREIEGLDAF